MPKIKIDSAFAATATCPTNKIKVTYWDTQISGFVLEVRSSGSATYAMRYIDEHGTQRQHRIGGRGDITFDQARKKARELRSKITLGGNPATDRATRKAIPTYNQLADQHLAYAKTYQKTPEHVDTTLRCHLRPKWGKMRLTEIKPQAISQWLADLRENGLAPATVEKIRVTFHRSFELAAKWQIPGGETNPLRAVPRPKFDNRKEKFLSKEEAVRLVAACEKSPNSQLASIVQLLLLTGARKQELLKARWEHVDLERKAWLIPDSKTGKARYVPLSSAAIEVIEGLRKWDKCPWLLPNPKTLEPYSGLKSAWTTAREKAGLPDLRIHDLRHSAASFMINAGTDLYAVGKVLGHADYQSTMRYSHLANDTLLAAVEAGAAGWTQPTTNN